MATLKGSWTHLLSYEPLQRSSQVTSIINDTTYVFGGELLPRQPRDNDIHLVKLPADLNNQSSSLLYSTHKLDGAPSPRVGSASAVCSGKLYIFSGRGGESMAPINESGALWCFDPESYTWNPIKPAAAPWPEARSYHTMASDGGKIIYLHAGCPEKGRLSDLWSFDTSTNKWTQLADAPDPPRGGPSIAWLDGKLYRMNGFDGTSEQGGAVDVYDPKSDSWSTKNFNPEGKTGPEARSVSALLPLKVNGKSYLITMFGEHDPSSLGHQGAGKMLANTWAYSVGVETWKEVRSSGSAPPARGWFAADVTKDGRVVVQGGLAESNERLDDLWVLQVTE